MTRYGLLILGVILAAVIAMTAVRFIDVELSFDPSSESETK